MQRAKSQSVSDRNHTILSGHRRRWAFARVGRALMSKGRLLGPALSQNVAFGPGGGWAPLASARSFERPEKKSNLAKADQSGGSEWSTKTKIPIPDLRCA